MMEIENEGDILDGVPSLHRSENTTWFPMGLPSPHTSVLNCPLNMRGEATGELRCFPTLPPASLREHCHSFLGHPFPCQAEKVFISALTLVKNLRVFS